MWNEVDQKPKKAIMAFKEKVKMKKKLQKYS